MFNVHRKKFMRTSQLQIFSKLRWIFLVAGLLFWSHEYVYAVTNDVGVLTIPEDANNQDDEDDNCDPPSANDGPQGTNSACGMPVWRVSEPFINLWLHDTPLRYRLENGQWMELKLSYKHRDEWEDRRQGIGGFGVKWECNWLGTLEMNSEASITNYLAGGGQSVFAVSGATPEYRSGRRMGSFSTSSSSSGSSAIAGGGGIAIHSPTGSQNQYGSLWTNPQGRQYSFLSKRLDRYGRTVNYTWETQGTGTNEIARLKEVVDRDGRICTIGYTNTSFPRLITSVTDPYGRSAYFTYNTNGLLASITDMAGMTSGFIYSHTNIISQLQTPYGTTTFNYFNETNAPLAGSETNRAIEITEADGSIQLYAYRSQTNGSSIAGTFAGNDGQSFARFAWP